MNSAGHYPRLCTLLFRRVGDSLLATPALRALKKGLPHYRLQVVTEPQTTRVFEQNPWVDDIITTDRVGALQLSRTIRGDKAPEISVDFLSDPRSAMACYLSGSRLRIGFAHPWRRHLYTRTAALQNPDAPVYSALHKLSLTELLEIHEDDDRTEFYLLHQDNEFADTIWSERGWVDTPVAAFFVHSRRDFKRWPLKYFSEVIQHLIQHGRVRPMVLNTPGDEEAVETLATLAHLRDSDVLAVRELGHLGAVLSRCALFIGNDGGPKHLAVAVGTPTVAVFRDERPEYWTPPHSSQHRAVSAAAGKLIDSIPPSEVIRTVEEVLSATTR